VSQHPELTRTTLFKCFYLQRKTSGIHILKKDYLPGTDFSRPQSVTSATKCLYYMNLVRHNLKVSNHCHVCKILYKVCRLYTYDLSAYKNEPIIALKSNTKECRMLSVGDMHHRRFKDRKKTPHKRKFKHECNVS
jgi:hypothetical protein